MPTDLKQQLKDTIKEAMRAKQKERLVVLRGISSEFKKVEVDERIDITDDRAITIMDKMLKQRRDAAKQYAEAERQDLADQEHFEIDIIQSFMPQALSDDEINAMISAAIEQTNASTMADMGKLMGLIKPQAQGRADMADISKRIKAALS